MKLRFGKAGWIELDQMPLASHVVEGVRVFEPATAAAGRAAFLTNAVVATTFGKAVPSFATATERERIGADKVESAAFRDKDGAVRVVYREAVVRFEPQATQAQRKALLDKFHLDVRARNTFHRDQVIVCDPRRTYIAERMCELANELTDSPEVAFAFPNFVSEFKRMAVPTPRAQQWHLPVVKARKAWASTLGNGITVAVLDDGVDVDHPNLKGNIRRNPDPGERRDLCGRDFFVGEDVPEHFDPRPKLFQAPFDQYQGNDIHGTCCAGVAAATGARAKVYGSAPKAWLLPVKVFHADALATESRVADAIRYATRFADILSCSWRGPESPDIEAALEEAGGGRGGKGCPVFVATGNEGANFVKYPARSSHAIAVGASTNKEKRADYSNFGPEVSVVAPSSGGTKAIFTTDVSLRNRGLNLARAAAGGADGLHTNAFGGTSSATPLAAGVAALILSANPNLPRGDVRKILQETADKIGPANAYKPNGYSDEYGYGRINAEEAVARALQLAAATPGAGTPARPPGRRIRARSARTTRRPSARPRHR